MKEIRIFLASSYELEPDRARIGNLFRELNDMYYEERGIHLHLVKWEDLDLFYNPAGKQAEYDFHIRNCELFIGLFWHVAGRHTVHEVEVAREIMLPENVLIFHKTAEFKPDHEGSEDEKRFLERHPNEKLDASREMFDAYLKEQKSLPYADFAGLRQILTGKLAGYCSNKIKFTDEDMKRHYSTEALQIHITASPEAEPDLARLGDLVRYLDENSKHYCRIRLIPEISGSDMFVSLCHTAAPEPMPQNIQTAVDCHSQADGKPRLYFCMKYVADEEKQESLKILENRISKILKNYPDRYYQSAEMKLHFLLQLEQLKRYSGREMLTVKNGTICLQSGESNFPLMSCDDMPSLQNDQVYKKLKEEQERILGKIEELRAQDAISTENLSKEIFRQHQELAEIQQQIDDRRTGYFRLARTLEEMVGREQDEEIVKIRKLIGKGMIDEARKLLPKGSAEFNQSVTAVLNANASKVLRLYDVCLLTIECLRAGNPRKNRDEIFKFYDSLVNRITPALQDNEKTAEACFSYGIFLYEALHYDKALEYYEKALTAWKQTIGENHPNTAACYQNIGLVWSDKGIYDKALGYYEDALKILLQVLGENHPHTAGCYNSIGNAWLYKGDYEKALGYHEKALKIRLQTSGADHPDTAASYQNIGLVWSDKGDYDTALGYYEKALKIRLHALGENHPGTAGCYNCIGNAWLYKGDYGKALGYYEKALKILLLVHGENHPDTARCYNNIGIAWDDKGDYNRALGYYEKALNIRLHVLGKNHPDTATCYNNIGNAWLHKGGYGKALEYYEKALNIRLQTLGGDHPDTAACYQNIGLVWAEKAGYDMALEYHEKALTVWMQTFGKNHPNTATCYNNIGNAWLHKGDYGKALEYYEKALTAWKRTFGENHPLTATCYQNIGLAWDDKGGYDTALEYHEKALKIRLHALGENHPDTARCYNNIGNACLHKGDYGKALEYHEKALAVLKQTFGGNHPDTATCYQNIGLVWDEKGDYDRALNFYEKAMKIQLHILGELHPLTANSYNNIGNAWRYKGDYEKALGYHEKALIIRLQTSGGDHPDVAACYQNIGIVWCDKKDYDTALSYYGKALKIWLHILGENHPHTAQCYNSIGNAWLGKGDSGKALEYYEKALAIRLRTLGENHPDVAMTYHNFGSLWAGKKKYDRALNFYEKALTIWRRTPGENHPLTAACYKNIGTVWLHKGDSGKALGYYEKALVIRLRTLGENHPDTVTCRNLIELAKNRLGKRDFVRLTDEEILNFTAAPGNSADRLGKLVDMLEERQEFSKALEVCRKALETTAAPDIIADLYRKIGELHEELGEPQSVLDEDLRAELTARRKALETTAAPDERAKLYRAIGALHRDLREPEEALAAYDEAIKLIAAQETPSPMAGTIYNEAGHLRCETDPEGALRDCREALRILRLHYDEKNPVIVKTGEFIREIQEKLDEDDSHK